MSKVDNEFRSQLPYLQDHGGLPFSPYATSFFFFPHCNMPPLHSLRLSPTASFRANNNSSSSRNTQHQWWASLSTKPSTLNPNISLDHPDLALPLPDIPAHVKEKILCLEIMGIDSGRAIAINPAIREASLDSIHSVVSYLQSKGIHYKDLARILGMCPKILTSSIASDIRPVFAFLSTELNVPDSNYRRVINKCPRLLVSSVRDQLKPALFYLQRLGFRDKEALAYHDTVLLVFSVEKTLIPKLEYLMGLGLSKADAVGMVLRCPGLFTFSIENNFKPKHAYFIDEIGGTLEDLREFPQYFAFGLEKRIKPRHRQLVECGMKVPLSVMLKSTDEEFKEMLKKSR